MGEFRNDLKSNSRLMEGSSSSPVFDDQKTKGVI